jgi:hypothetical protein
MEIKVECESNWRLQCRREGVRTLTLTLSLTLTLCEQLELTGTQVLKRPGG